MKRKHLVKGIGIALLISALLATIFLIVSKVEERSGLAIDESNFPDEVFREYVRGFDTSEGGYLSEEEIKAVQEVRVVYRRDVEEISSLQGIEYLGVCETPEPA